MCLLAVFVLFTAAKAGANAIYAFFACFFDFIGDISVFFMPLLFMPRPDIVFVALFLAVIAFCMFGLIRRSIVHALLNLGYFLETRMVLRIPAHGFIVTPATLVGAYDKGQQHHKKECQRKRYRCVNVFHGTCPPFTGEVSTVSALLLYS